MALDIEQLNIQVSTSTKGVASSLNGISKSLNTLRDAFTNLSTAPDPTGSITALCKGIKELSSGAENADKAAKTITSICDAIKKFGNKSMISAIDRMTDASAALELLTESVKGLASVGNGFESVTGNLNNVKEAFKSAKTEGIDPFVNALNKANTEAKKTGTTTGSTSASATSGISGIASFVSGIKSAIPYVNTFLNIFNTVGNVFDSIHAKFERFTKVVVAGLATITAKAVAFLKQWRTVYELIQLSNKYVEDFNLFTVSLGEYADAAQEYAEKVSDIMGIDPAAWMRNQGVFNTIIKGFGVASDRAYTMSQQLTQLGYDISSFYNIDVEEAMTKLTSGISGELEPLRRLGYDLSVARLEQEKLNVTFPATEEGLSDLTIALDDATLSQEALNRGITKSVADMTQAEKAQLRYFAIMTQVTDAQGDMSRTLETPANQLRILSAQFNMAGREIGNIFIPALNAMLPYAIAATRAVRELASYLASLAGYKFPEIDWDSSNTVAQIEDVEDAWDGASAKAKEFKKFLLGIDELNIIPSTNASGRGYGDDMSAGWEDFELPTYDFIGDATNNRVNEIYEKIIDLFKNNAPEEIGSTIGGWIQTELDKIDWPSIQSKAGEVGRTIANFLNGLITPDTLGSLGFTVGGAVETGLTLARNFLENADFYEYGKSVAEFLNNTIESINPEDLGASISGLINGIWDFAKGFFNNVKYDEVVKFFKETIENLRINPEILGAFAFNGFLWSDKLSEAINGALLPSLTVILVKATEIFKSFVNTIRPLLQPIADLIIGIMQGVSSAVGAATSLGASEGLISTIQGLLKKKSYATGGFPEDGLFFANSGEMVGSFANGRTAVANNDQIVAGISEGVRSAVMSALNSSGIVEAVMSGKSINIDGKEIMNVVVRQNNRAINRTGVSPIRT